ncbi:MAG: tetratricopeptide repeat protein, partial [Planctomycetaceae bacterium]|nr:tetratricopeptide repeat protein [Planctomycetaceae bacterium]
MIFVLRILIVLLVAEVVACGYWISSTPTLFRPPLPQADFQDPIYTRELNKAVEETRLHEPNSFAKLGDILISRGYYAYAEHCYAHHLTLNPEDLRVRFMLAYCLDRTGRVNDSDAYYLDVAKENPQEEDLKKLVSLARYSIGRNALRNEKQADALVIFQNTFEFSPAVVQCAKLLIRSDRAQEAMPLLDQLIVEIPNSLVLRFWKARALEQLGQSKEALESFHEMERCAYLLPTDFRVSVMTPIYNSYGLAAQIQQIQAALGQEDLRSAHDQITRLNITAEPPVTQDRLSALRLHGDIALRIQSPTELLKVSQQLRSLDEDSTEVLNWEASAAYIQGNQNGARQLWEKLTLMESSEQLFRNLQTCLIAAGESEQADHMLALGLVEAGKRNFRLNQPEEAANFFQQAVEVDKSLEDAWFNLGLMQHYLNLPEAAAHSYQKALELNPNDGRTQRNLQLLPPI